MYAIHGWSSMSDFFFALSRERWGTRITGALYLHPAGSDLDSDQLKQNISALCFLLGDFWLPRLTIAVIANASDGSVDDNTLRTLKEPTSPFHSAYVAGAKIEALSLEPPAIRDILLNYTQIPPQMPHVQTKFRIGRTQRLSAYIEEGLGRGSHNTTGPRSHRQRTTDHRRSSLKATLEESTDSIKKLELALIESQAETDSLRDQLEQNRSEYASLRSELQLQDNMEQSKIVESLKNLNRNIENFGRAVAERLVDDYIGSPAPEFTTLQASNLSGLKTQFGHHEGEASLVLSSSGAGMMAEDFLDLALRSLICRQIHEKIFLPFHPALASSTENMFVTDLYEKIRLQGEYFPMMRIKYTNFFFYRRAPNYFC